MSVWHTRVLQRRHISTKDVVWLLIIVPPNQIFVFSADTSQWNQSQNEFEHLGSDLRHAGTAKWFQTGRKDWFWRKPTTARVREWEVLVQYISAWPSDLMFKLASIISVELKKDFIQFAVPGKWWPHLQNPWPWLLSLRPRLVVSSNPSTPLPCSYFPPSS